MKLSEEIHEALTLMFDRALAMEIAQSLDNVSFDLEWSKKFRLSPHTKRNIRRQIKEVGAVFQQLSKLSQHLHDNIEFLNMLASRLTHDMPDERWTDLQNAHLLLRKIAEMMSEIADSNEIPKSLDKLSKVVMSK